MNTNQRKYVEFIKAKFPALYERAMDEVARQQRVAGLGDWGNFFNNFTAAVEKITPTIIQAKGQRDLLKVNLNLAKQGKDPIKAENYAPAMKVQVEPSFNIPPAVTWIGGGLVALLLIRKLVKG